MTDDKQNGLQGAIEELLTDPDAPEKGSTTPPQTTDAEPVDDQEKE